MPESGKIRGLSARAAVSLSSAAARTSRAAGTGQDDEADVGAVRPELDDVPGVRLAGQDVPADQVLGAVGAGEPAYPAPADCMSSANDSSENSSLSSISST